MPVRASSSWRNYLNINSIDGHWKCVRRTERQSTDIWPTAFPKKCKWNVLAIDSSAWVWKDV